MKLWILTVGEPTPADEGSPRFLRSGVIARMARERGHDVTWWTSTVEHMKKNLRFPRSTRKDHSDGPPIWYLHGGMYAGNISSSRLLNHARVAREFLRLSRSEERPDVIYCSLPLIELAAASVLFKRRTGCKLVLDVRDFWPDIWADRQTGWRKGLVRFASTPWEAALRFAVRNADCIYGFTDEAVDWALEKAGRRRTENDRAFPFAYPLSPVSEADDAQARRFWDEAGITGEQTTLSFIGSISSTTDSGLRTLARAVHNLDSATRARLRIVLAGTGESVDEMKRLTRGLPEVSFPGWIDYPKIRALMQRSHMGLLPYPNSYDFLRAIPNKFPEYMSGELPVLTSLQGVVGRLVTERHCGICYNEGNVDELAGILSRIARSREELRSMSANAAALYDGMFRPEAVYGTLIDTLAELAR